MTQAYGGQEGVAVRGPDADLRWIDEAYKTALVNLLVYGSHTPPADDPMWCHYQNLINPLPWHIPDTKEVEAIVAKHLPDAPKDDRPAIRADARRHEPWYKRWFTNPEPTFVEFTLRPDLTPEYEPVVIQPAVMHAEPDFPTDSLMPELVQEVTRAALAEWDKGILDGLDLAIEHLEAKRQTIDTASYTGEVRDAAFIDCIESIQKVKARALGLVEDK